MRPAGTLRSALIGLMMVLQLSPGFSFGVCPEGGDIAGAPAIDMRSAAPCPGSVGIDASTGAIGDAPADHCTTLEIASTCGSCSLPPTPPSLATAASPASWAKPGAVAIRSLCLPPEPRPPAT